MEKATDRQKTFAEAISNTLKISLPDRDDKGVYRAWIGEHYREYKERVDEFRYRGIMAALCEASARSAPRGGTRKGGRHGKESAVHSGMGRGRA